MSNPEPASVAELVAAVPVFAPLGRGGRGRLSAATVRPGHTLPDKVVVDFGWRSSEAVLDLEVATRRWDAGAAPDARHLRAFCAERDFMQRRARGAADWSDPSPAAEAAWSGLDIALDGVPRPFTVLTTAHSWVAATALDGEWLVRLFAQAAPEGLAGLRRVVDETELEPVRGRS
ncbi:hypothetical protein [Actinorugispora endophytica]|uniref:Uncharacterized protein n=1 Tax=Actinorugispora endophytica TaxID=1605990 RepID=A0A4R6UHI7_9ACTN|nr:hypothetical protein [Actinorugispora endophytica]TDQ46331.1 hypothetical protein EV190_12518 [Actinorugispora endophytica]